MFRFRARPNVFVSFSRASKIRAFYKIRFADVAWKPRSFT